MNPWELELTARNVFRMDFLDMEDIFSANPMLLALTAKAAPSDIILGPIAQLIFSI